jgi:hypothetical protein
LSQPLIAFELLLQGDVRGSRTGVWNEGSGSLVVADGLTSFVALYKSFIALVEGVVALVTESLILIAIS